ncbi:MAG: SLOG family protein [Candidatus Dojkabacteria bacterium]
MNKVLICGSRTWIDEKRIYDFIKSLDKDTIVIQGHANGADIIAFKSCIKLCVPVVCCPADWERDGRSAGSKRNMYMLDKFKPHRVVAFMVGESRGTRHMVNYAKEHGVPTEVFHA